MKTDKEFIKGIYEKYDEYTKEKQENKQKILKKIINVAAVIIVLISSVIVFSESEPKQVLIDNKKVENDQSFNSNIKTVGNFENFYEIIKEKYASTQTSIFNGENDAIQDETKNNAVLESIRSDTNVQVQNVDEADIVKVDNKYIYYVSTKKVVIIDAENPETSEKVSEISFENENFYPREIYVNTQKLVIVGNEYDDTFKTDIVNTSSQTYDMINIKDNSKSGIIIYDITNIKEPKEIRRVMVDGMYLSSRKIENYIYLVVNKYIYTPDIKNNSLEELEQYQNQYKPKYIDTAVGEEEKYIDYDKIYCLDGTDEANYLILTGVNIDSKDEADIQTFLGAGQYIYSSEKNMYIATNKATYGDNYEILSENTHILKVALDNGKFIFKVEVDIDGQINNQFSMDENGDTFRIATTTGNMWNIDENTSNSIYILNDNLEEIGRLAEFAKGEKIYSVRYVGDKAYVVTFKQTDPLFVIDLSNTSNPQILGELKIPGYSTYLHPYDETHLMGFGYDTKEDGTQITTNGLKMVMFDVSDLNNPKELFKINIGDSKYTYSELLSDHKALLFSKENNIIAFPIYSSSGKKSYTRAAIYEIDLEKGFSLKGEIGTVTDKADEHIERIVFINHNYYTLSKSLVKVANMETLEVVKEIEI